MNFEAEIKAFVESLSKRGMRGCYIAIVSANGKVEGCCVAMLPWSQDGILVAAGDDLMLQMKIAETA